jgi:hypothetical protein
VLALLVRYVARALGRSQIYLSLELDSCRTAPWVHFIRPDGGLVRRKLHAGRKEVHWSLSCRSFGACKCRHGMATATHRIASASRRSVDLSLGG